MGACKIGYLKKSEIRITLPRGHKRFEDVARKQSQDQESKKEHSKMSIKEINWRSFLSPDCNLHPDVTFRVVTENCEDSVKTFVAHKFLLAAVSPVFEGMFFGPGVSKSRYIGISIAIIYSNFSRFYKKLGPFYKKLRCDKFGN